jgi:hypothetical protein
MPDDPAERTDQRGITQQCRTQLAETRPNHRSRSISAKAQTTAEQAQKIAVNGNNKSPIVIPESVARPSTQRRGSHAARWRRPGAMA